MLFVGAWYLTESFVVAYVGDKCLRGGMTVAVDGELLLVRFWGFRKLLSRVCP